MYDLVEDIAETIFNSLYLALFFLFGPHRLLVLTICWYYENYGRHNRNSLLYNRVGVPLAGVITHRKFQKDRSVLFRYAYRPISNPSTIYIRDFIREPQHQDYPWNDFYKTIVIVQVPGHNASGIEMRKLSEPAERYWKRITVSCIVSFFTISVVSEDPGFQQEFVPLSLFLLMLTACVASSPTTDADAVYDKIDLNDPSSLEEHTTPPDEFEETSPTEVQDMARHEILPALERAEAVIARHLQSIDRRNAGELDRTLLRFYARRGNATRVRGPVVRRPTVVEPGIVEVAPGIVQATAVTPCPEVPQSRNVAQLPSTANAPIASRVVEHVPLLPANAVQTAGNN